MIQKGDLLFYYKDSHMPTFVTKLIDFGEELEDGVQPKEYFHCAIAIDDILKIEADGHDVAIHKIDYKDGFDVYRLPVSQDKIDPAFKQLEQMIDEGYDWYLILDDAIRYPTYDLLHLPEEFISKEEQHKKICSTLLETFMVMVQFLKDYLDKQPSPEDLYLLVKDYIQK